MACRRIVARIFNAKQSSIEWWEGDSFHALGAWLFPLSIFGDGSYFPEDSLTVLEGSRVPLKCGWPGLFDSTGVPATGAGASNAGSLGLFGNRPTLDYLDSGRVADLIRTSIKGILVREPAVSGAFLPPVDAVQVGTCARVANLGARCPIRLERYLANGCSVETMMTKRKQWKGKRL